MYVWLCLLTGLATGACARLVPSRHPFALGSDIALGALGGVLAGLVLRVVGGAEAGALPWTIGAALAGALGMLLVARTLVRLRSGEGPDADPAAATARGTLPTPRSIDRAGLLHQALVAGLSDVERSVLGKFLNRETVVRDVEREHQERKTFGERATDRIAAFGGSWAFLGLFGAMLATWMLYNVDAPRAFDPYPFILLNLALSCIAAVQAPIILMSQNRQAQKDRLNAAADYEVNMKAEMEILALHEKLDALREKAWRDLIELQQEQIERLRRIEASAANR